MTDFLADLGRELERAGERLDRGGRRRVPRVALALAAAALVVAVAGVLLMGGAPEPERAVPAVTATPTAKPTRAEKQDRYYRFTPEEALRTIDRFLHIPVAVPAGLPNGTGAHPEVSAIDDERRAHMALRLPDGSFLQIYYGWAGFDGCGPLGEPDVVDIDGARGLAYENRGNVTVLWPVKEGDLEGTYGIYGEMSAERALDLARSMDVTSEERTRPDRGC